MLMSHLRLVTLSDDATNVLTYENWMGDRYYLQESRTKTGKKRYFFTRTVRSGALARMPDGYEVTESINGVVSVRRKKPGEVILPAADMSLVHSALERQRHLRWFRAQAVGNAIVIFEPHRRPEELRSLSSHFVFHGQFERYVEERMRKQGTHRS
jgi:hypothetical protein